MGQQPIVWIDGGDAVDAGEVDFRLSFADRGAFFAHRVPWVVAKTALESLRKASASPEAPALLSMGSARLFLGVEAVRACVASIVPVGSGSCSGGGEAI